MKRNKWIELYHLALLEMAETELRYVELSRCIAIAQKAMELRRQELLNDKEHGLERKALEHALYNLQSAMQELAVSQPLGRA